MALKKLKEKWKIVSNFQLIVIFIVFGITGSLSVKLGEPLLHILKNEKKTFSSLSMGYGIYWFLRLLIIFPLYQLLLVLIGALFFQFRFFWEFEKKILCRMGFKKFFKEKEKDI